MMIQRPASRTKHRLLTALFLVTVPLLISRAQSQSLWITNGELTPQAAALMRTLEHADDFGLEPSDYAVPNNAPLATNAVRQSVNAALTDAAARFVHDLHFGRVDPKNVGFHFTGTPKPFDVQQALQQLANAKDVQVTLATFQPRARPYWLLISALAHYRELAKTPELTRLPPLPHTKVTVGTIYQGAPALRRLLKALGDFAEEDSLSESLMFDARLEAAVKGFQARHGITADGVLGRQTYAALLTPLSVRVRQIELALERWRWTSFVERPDIVINVPQFMFYALPRANDANATLLEMPVIVGQSADDHQTPIFTAELKRVIFQPYWDVPYSILHKELLPLIRKDPRYLQKHDMQIVSGDRDDSPILANDAAAIEALAAGKARLRQRPGPQNALGPVKFVLPNAYNVYLHGTPETALFGKARRAFSHGCVRVSDPAALAEYVLKNAPEPWDANAIQTAMCGKTQIRINLKTPLRVMFFYSTVAATDSEGVLFADDVYGEDAKLEALLHGRTRQSGNSSR